MPTIPPSAGTTVAYRERYDGRIEGLREKRVITDKVAFVGGTDTGGGIFAWQNKTGKDIAITNVLIDLTTVASGACTADIGTTATNATTSSNNLLTGLDLNAATGLFDNNTDKGASGKTRQRLSAGKWITASKASGASAGAVGAAYISYIELD